MEKILEETGDGQRWLLAAGEPYLFACSLVALWNKGAVPVLSSVLQPGTIAELEGCVEGIVTDEKIESAVRTVMVDEVSAKKTPCEEPWFEGNREAIVMFTSGTTGEKKEVVKTFRQLFEEVQVLDAVFGDLVRGSLRASTVSHFHIYGFLFNILWPLCFLCETAKKRELYFEHIFTRARQDRVCIVSSPANLRFFADVCDGLDFNRKGTVLFSSGGALSAEVALAIEKTGVSPPVEVYGSTETGGIAWRRQLQGRNAMFTPFEGVKTSCDNDGRLLVQSGWSSRDSGWVHTGDRAEIIDRDRFVLLGRCDRVVKVAGKRVSLTEMENLLLASPGVEEVKVFKFQEDDLSNRSALASVIRVDRKTLNEIQNSRQSRQKMIAKLRRSLQGGFEMVTLPRRWRFVEELPADAQGKTTMEALKGAVHDE